MKKTILLSAGLIALLSSTSLLAQDTLKILTWKGYAPKALVEKFEKQTGLKVELTYSNNEEMIAKLRATRGAGFDLAQPSQDRISSVQKKYKISQTFKEMVRGKIANFFEICKISKFSIFLKVSEFGRT